MKSPWRILSLVAILFVSVSSTAPVCADWSENGLWIVGDEEFVAQVNRALELIGYAQWLPYVRQNLIEIKQWNGDEEAHVGIVLITEENCDEHNICKGIFLVRRDLGDVAWYAMAIVHEAAHIQIRNQSQRPIHWEDECPADAVTAAFAALRGWRWQIRCGDKP